MILRYHSNNMKELLLLRHAKSDRSAPEATDFGRGLNGRGRRAAKRMGRYLVASGLAPDLVLCSQARRARETLEHLGQAIPADARICLERGLYLAGSQDVLARLARVANSVDRVLVVGHNPGLQDLAVALAPARSDQAPGTREMRLALALKFPTAALVRFEIKAGRWSELSSRLARLLAFVTPADLEAADAKTG